MNNAGSQLIAGLEVIWSEIQAMNIETPDVIMTVGPTHRQKPSYYGYFCANAWKTSEEQKEEEQIHEILLVSEALDRPAVEVFNTMLHESVHSIAQVRDIKDVTGSSRHNKKFKRLAEEFGMYYTDTTAHPTHGYAFVEMYKETQDLFRPTIDKLEQVLKLYRRPPQEKKNPVIKKIYACGCERTASFPKKLIDAGPIVCGLCATKFEEETED